MSRLRVLDLRSPFIARDSRLPLPVRDSRLPLPMRDSRSPLTARDSRSPISSRDHFCGRFSLRVTRISRVHLPRYKLPPKPPVLLTSYQSLLFPGGQPQGSHQLQGHHSCLRAPEVRQEQTSILCGHSRSYIHNVRTE